MFSLPAHVARFDTRVWARWIHQEEGSLGLDLRETADGAAVEIGGLKPDTQAIAHSAVLEIGLVLTGIVFEKIIGHPSRPLKLRFEAAGSLPEAAQVEIVVTFTKEGSVGLDLTVRTACPCIPKERAQCTAL
jgi:hypothetical protein